MQQITKVVHEIGNGGHVYLPKEMVGYKVVITLASKSAEEIEEEIVTILRPHLEHIQGIYLYGSYARGEQLPDSDIDVLVISDGKIKLKKRVNSYEISSSSLEQMEATIKNNAPLILPILKEARPILNRWLIEKYQKEQLTKKNTEWYIETTETSLSLAKYIIEERDAKNIPSIVYHLVLRLRGLYIIESLIKNSKYSNKAFNAWLAKEGFSMDKTRQIYSLYREYRDNRKVSDSSVDYEDIDTLYGIAHRYFKRVKTLWEKLD